MWVFVNTNFVFIFVLLNQKKWVQVGECNYVAMFGINIRVDALRSESDGTIIPCIGSVSRDKAYAR